MTREEAIEIINLEKKHCEVHLNDSGKTDEYYKEMNEFVEAYDMAIKALEAPPNDNWAGYSKRLWKSAYEYCKEDADAEQTSVLDKIRAEIIQMPTISFNANDIYKADVLAIIDKYMAESEDKE